MVPENIKSSIDLYVQKGIPAGSCTEAILSNDLFDAFGRADEWTTAAMKQIVQYIYMECPSGCHGSREIYRNWIARGGLEGIQKEETANG